MKSLPIPEADQVRAMLDGSIFDLLRSYTDLDPERVDLGEFISITRMRLIAALARMPERAQAYLDERATHTATHDVGRIWQEGSKYLTGSMDRGQPVDVRQFRTLAEALADYLLTEHGIFDR